MSKNTISIKKIAELAGTSVATVSRVINHNGRYSKETEEKILQIMKEYNYQPNYLAKALRENKTNLIGVIIPDITHMFFAKLYRAIETQLYEYGYLPVLCDTNEEDELEKKYIDNLSNLRFAGLICMNGTHLSLPSNIPIVYVDRYPSNVTVEDMHFIGCDNYRGGYLAGETLIKAGRKHFSIVYHNKAIATMVNRYFGFRKALEDHGLSLEKDFVFTVDNVTFEEGYDITEKIVTLHKECDAIFYTSDILAIGGLNYIRNHNISVPEDISIIGFDDIPLSSYTDLTTINQHTSLMGSDAAKTIVDMINGKETEKTQIYDVELIERKTV